MYDMKHTFGESFGSVTIGSNMSVVSERGKGDHFEFPTTNLNMK
jgi:hypothetical protein